MKKVALMLLSVGCCALPACLSDLELFGLGTQSILDVGFCAPDDGPFSVCADVKADVDLGAVVTNVLGD